MKKSKWMEIDRMGSPGYCWISLPFLVRPIAILLDESDNKWKSFDLPIRGEWNTVDEAKTAVIAAVRKQAQKLIDSLPE